MVRGEIRFPRKITRDNPADVDGRVLLLPSHHVEAKALVSLGQLDHSRMGVTLGGSKSGHSSLGSRRSPEITMDYSDSRNNLAKRNSTKTSLNTFEVIYIS